MPDAEQVEDTDAVGVASAALLARAMPPVVSQRVARLARGALLAIARRTHGRALELVEDDRVVRLAGEEPAVRVDVHDARSYSALLRHATVGLGESYVAGWWDADDLCGLVRSLSQRSRPLLRRLDDLGRRTRALDRLVVRRAPDRGADQRNVSAHYDVSNDLYRLMLDETMTYSCGIFEDASSTLREAQVAKLDRICRKLDLREDDHLVEIGTGWGSLALHAATRYGCRVTTTTISHRQRELATERVTKAGLTGRIQVADLDWRDLEGTYDKLVSIEMIEAVDWRHHDEFLAKCAALLRPGGLAALQVIVIDDRSFDRAKRHQDFLRRMIFPSGCLPSVASLIGSLARATDLRVVDVEDISAHYPPTLRAWAANLAASHDELRRLGAPEPFLRLWALYLAYAEAAFHEDHIGDVQVLLRAPAARPSA